MYNVIVDGIIICLLRYWNYKLLFGILYYYNLHYETVYNNDEFISWTIEPNIYLNFVRLTYCVWKILTCTYLFLNGNNNRTHSCFGRNKMYDKRGESAIFLVKLSPGQEIS